MKRGQRRSLLRIKNHECGLMSIAHSATMGYMTRRIRTPNGVQCYSGFCARKDAV